MEEIMQDVRKQKRQKFKARLNKWKGKDQKDLAFRKIAIETMAMYSERKMLLKNGDTERFNLKKHYLSISDVYKDDKIIFNKVGPFSTP